MNKLCDLIARHCPNELTPTLIPQLILSRSDVTTKRSAAMYYPLLCVLSRGRKKVFLGSQELTYDADSYLIASADLPVSGQVIEAPYLGLTLALDTGTLAELLLEMPASLDLQEASQALSVNPLEENLLDGLVRLLGLLDRPADIPVLSRLIQREILYALLRGPRGGMLRQLALPNSQLSQIRRAIQVIRERFDQKIIVHELARVASMSDTSFHRHFRAVTGMSPLRFQKCIRLQEARRMLLTQDLPAARVGSDVGYESASQFSREYRRSFGASPARDAAEARRTLHRPALEPAIVR